MFKSNNKLLSLFILLSLLELSLALNQEWLFWPSNSNNGTIVVNSADNKSRIKNFKKAETLNLRYSITDELEKIISPSTIYLNGKVASIDMTYISREMQFNKELRMDKNFMPLFGTYETGLHIAITTNKDIKGREAVQKFLEDSCEFVHQLFHEYGYSVHQKSDYVHFKNLIKMGQISPRYFYMFLSDFTLETIEGFSLYHIFKLGKRNDLDLGCDFDVEAISEWTSRYFKIVVSRHATMLNEKDVNNKEEGERESTLMIKFEEILHLQFPETVECNVNQRFSEIKYIEKIEKTTNNAFSITTIKPRGVKNEEIAFLPCPLPKVKFSYRLNPGVGLHPILYTTVEVDDWVENKPLVMLLTFDPNIFADEYQISDQRYDSNVHVSVLGHPDLEVAVNDPQAKFNYVKVIFDNLVPKTNVTLEIPFHVRYPESEPISTDNLMMDSKDVDKTKEQRSEQEIKQEEEEKKKKEMEKNSIDHLYKAIFIHPPRFYTTSTKLCHQEAYSSSNLPMRLLASAGEKDRNSISIIPVRVASSDKQDGNERITSNVIPPLRMDIPKGQLADYQKITFITTLITSVSIVLIFIWILKYSDSPITLFSKSSKKPANKKKN